MTPIMTPRQRLLAAFSGQPVDRLPVSPFIHENYVRAFLDDPAADPLECTPHVYSALGFDLMHRNIPIRHNEWEIQGPDWEVEKIAETTNSSRVERYSVRTPRGRLSCAVRFEQASRFKRVSAVVEPIIKSKTDFELLAAYQPPVPVFDAAPLRRARAIVGDQGIVAPWAWGTLNFAADYRGLSDLLVDAIDDPGFFHAMLEYLVERLKTFLAPVLAERPEVLCHSGNLATGSMVGPNFHREHVFRWEREIISYIQKRGVHVLYHNCGDGRSMIELYNDLGMHAFETLTEPPYADFDLADALRRFSPSVALVGNIDQIALLRSGKPAKVRAAVARVLNLAGGRPGFILGTSDFLEDDTPLENIRAFRDAAGIGAQI